MSYWKETDTLDLHIFNKEASYRATLFVSKSNMQHFESPDCPTTMFHRLTSVSHTGSIVDSVVIVRPDVDFLQDENIKIYFHTAP